jgi:hypothetical protein
MDRETRQLLDRLYARLAILEERLGRIPARLELPTGTGAGVYVGRVKSGSSIPRNGKGTVIRWKVSATGGGSVISPTIEDDVVDFFGVPSAVSPVDPNVAVKYARVNGVFTLIDYDCEAVT